MLQHDHRRGRGARGWPHRPRGPRDRARAALGSPRWQRQPGRRHGARAGARRGPRDLRRRALLADRAGGRGPARLAPLDRRCARDLRFTRADAPAARRPVPARAPPRSVVRARGGRVPRERGGGRCADPAAARPRTGDGHDGRDGHAGPERRQHGPGVPAAVRRRGVAARGLHARGRRPAGRGVHRFAAAPRRDPAARRCGRSSVGRPRGARRDRPAVRRVHVRAGAGCGGSGRRRSGGRVCAGSPRSVGQRSALPELRRVADGPVDDLPAGVVRAPAGRQGALRPDGPLPGEPLRGGARPRPEGPRRRASNRPAVASRRAASPAGRTCRPRTGAGPCCA